MPAAGYYWTPGYWAWNNDDYYWVPGVWVAPPAAGPPVDARILGVRQRRLSFHRGYWGPRVGFYGGVNYGYGYNGLRLRAAGVGTTVGFSTIRPVNNFGVGARRQRLPAGQFPVPPGASRASFNGGPAESR